MRINKRNLVIVLFAYFMVNGFSQATETSTLTALYSFMKSDYNYKNEQQAYNSSIEGSPYLNDEFTNGQLFFEGKLYKNLLLRYNIYEGHFEFKKDDEILYLDPFLSQVDTVWIGSEKYIFSAYKKANDIKKSYMHLIYNGSCQLLTLKEVTLLQAEQTSGYEDPKPARFHQGPDDFYIKTPGNIAAEFKNKKSIDDIFGEKSDKLNTYAKKNKLKLKNMEDIIQLCQYYDGLD